MGAIVDGVPAPLISGDQATMDETPSLQILIERAVQTSRCAPGRLDAPLRPPFELITRGPLPALRTSVGDHAVRPPAARSMRSRYLSKLR